MKLIGLLLWSMMICLGRDVKCVRGKPEIDGSRTNLYQDVYNNLCTISPGEESKITFIARLTLTDIKFKSYEQYTQNPVHLIGQIGNNTGWTNHSPGLVDGEIYGYMFEGVELVSHENISATGRLTLVRDWAAIWTIKAPKSDNILYFRIIPVYVNTKLKNLNNQVILHEVKVWK